MGSGRIREKTIKRHDHWFEGLSHIYSNYLSTVFLTAPGLASSFDAQQAERGHKISTTSQLLDEMYDHFSGLTWVWLRISYFSILLNSLFSRFLCYKYMPSGSIPFSGWVRTSVGGRQYLPLGAKRSKSMIQRAFLLSLNFFSFSTHNFSDLWVCPIVSKI